MTTCPRGIDHDARFLACGCRLQDELRADIDRARARAMELEEENAHLENDIRDCLTCRTLDQALAREAELEGQVGRLREALKELRRIPWTVAQRIVDAALSSTPATPWISPEEQKRREDAMVEAARRAFMEDMRPVGVLERMERAMRAAVAK